MDTWNLLFILLVAAQSSSSFLLMTTTTSPLITMTSHDLNITQTTHVVLTENVKTYWIRKPQDFTLLYAVVPIAVGTLLIVLVFFLWMFSERAEATEQFDYEQLNDDGTLGEPIAGPSSLASSFQRPPAPASPTHPAVDQILDLPYTNANEVITEDHNRFL